MHLKKIRLHINAFAELRCSAISSPITPSIDHTAFSSFNEHMSSDLDTHFQSYQPLIQRTSMGNVFVKCSSSVDDIGSSSNDAQVEVVTGTEGSLFTI